ncbi:mucin-17-like [Lingula anatina]|uniref:Mucin-17-like n=1 Tax=Lingula anatina TaxID=7574 RepID=A0A2R2MR26_LINAN|nr:mucin-17-like [Lingula anatina]|eukprot:XP_023932462.1 mucin-17-like [Lingula anatina]
MAAPPSSSSNVVKVAPNIATVKPMKIPGGISTTTSSTQNIQSIPAMNKAAPQNGNTEGQYINGNLYQLAVVTIDGEKKRILIPAQSMKTLSGTPVLLCQKTNQGYRCMSVPVPSTTTTKTTNTPTQTGYSLINAPQQLTSDVFDASASNLQKSVSRSLLPSFDANKVNQGLASQSGSPNDVAATPVSVVNGSPSATLQGLSTISAIDHLKDIVSQVQRSASPTVQLTQPTSTVKIANTSVPVASSSKFVRSNVTVVQPFMVSGANKNTVQPGATSLTNFQRLQQPILTLISKEASAQPSIAPFPNATNSQPAVSSVTNAASVPQRVFIVPPVSCQKSGPGIVTTVLPAIVTTAASPAAQTITSSDVAVEKNTAPAVLNLLSANNSQTKYSFGQQFQSSNGQSFVLVTRPTSSCVQQSQRTNTCVEAPDELDQTSASNAPDTCQGALESSKPLFQIQDVYTLNSSNISSEHVAKKTERCSKDVANKGTESVSELNSEPETDPGSLDESEETNSADTESDYSEDAFKEKYNEDLKRGGDQVQTTGKLQVLQTSQEDDTCSLNLDCEDVYDEDTEDGDLENEDDTLGKTNMLTTIENESSEMQSLSQSDASVSGAFERNSRNVIENIYLENNNELNENESEMASLSKVHGSNNEVAVKFDRMNKMKSCSVSLRRVVLPKNRSAFRTCEVERLSVSKGIGAPANKHMAVQQCSNNLGSGKSQVKLQENKHGSAESKKQTVFQKVPVTTAALSNVKILTVNTDKTTDTEANQASLKATGPTPKAPAGKEWERFIFFKLNGKAILVPVNKKTVTMASSPGAKSIICRNGKYFFQGSPASVGNPEKCIVQNSSVEASTHTKYPAPTLPVAADRFDSKPNQCTALAGTSHSALNIPSAEESNSLETTGQNLPTSNFKVKCEPTTYGYGDEVAPSTSTMNTVNYSTGEQNQLSDIASKPVKTEPEDFYLVPNKIQKVEHGNGSVIQEFQSERIRKLKEKLRQQNEALEELRRKLKSKPSTAFEDDDS